MRVPTLIAAVLLFAAAPALAQESADRGVDVGFSTGYIFFGPIVPEVTHHVRLGNMGQDQFFQVQLDKPLSDELGFMASMTVTPTQIYQWPKEEEISRIGWRTGAGARAWNTTWSCLTLGLRHRPVDWVEGSAGAGLCSVSGANYKQFGAAPMTSGTLQFGAHALKKLTDGVALDLACTVYPSYSSRATGQPFTVYRDMAGYEDYNSGFWVAPLQCGVGLRAGLR